MTPVKHDGGKARFDLLPVNALEQVTQALGYGAGKYAPHNYRTGGGLAWGRIFGAIMRHAWAFWRGEDMDPESGLHHLAHCGASVLMLFQLVLDGNGSDDRYKPEAV
jgi:hypothetical protein